MKSPATLSILILIALWSQHAITQPINWQRIGPAGNVFDIAIDANDRIFVIVEDTLYRSTDFGNTWARLQTGLPDKPWFSHLVVSPRGDVLVCCDQGILRSTDEGGTWHLSQQAHGPYGIVANSLGYLFTAECFAGILRSTDNGVSWVQVLDSADVHGIVIDGSDGIIAGVGGRGPGARGFRSTDNGHTWHPYAHGFSSLANTSTGTMFAGKDVNDMWGLRGGGYIFRSTDAGVTWDSVYQYSAYDVLVNAKGQVFAGGPSRGVVTSFDNGGTWEDVSAGLTAECVYSFAKTSQDTILAGTENGLFRSTRTTPIARINSDFYVDPAGKAINSGLSRSEPIRSIADALSRIYADSLRPRTVHIANGVYSEQGTGEAGTIYLRDFVSLVGESQGGVVVATGRMRLDGDAEVGIRNMTLEDCTIDVMSCDPILSHLTLRAAVAGLGLAKKPVTPNPPAKPWQMVGAHQELGISPDRLTSAKQQMSGEAGNFSGPGVWLYESKALIEEVGVSGTTDEAGILMYRSSPLLRNVTISGNKGWLCGGIRIEENSSPVLMNVTIAGNSGMEIGGVHSNAGSHPVFINCIIYDNSLPEIELRGFANSDCSIAFSHCDVEGGKGKIHVVNDGGVGTVYWLTGNIDSIPQFADPHHGDFHLQGQSPCIDAGTPFFVWQGDTLLRMKVEQYTGAAPDMGAFEFVVPLGVSRESFIPQSVTLHQNFPNPFNPTTTIRYSIPHKTAVQLSVFNTLGQQVAQLANGDVDAGYHEVKFDGSGLSSGVYFYRMQAGDFVQARKLLLIR